MPKAVAALAAIAALTGCSAGVSAPGPRAGSAGPTTVISFNAAKCGGRWQASPGMHTFLIRNGASAAAEVNLINPASNAIYGILEALGPDTSGTMRVVLGSGDYAFQCVIDDVDPFTGPTVRIPGHAKGTQGIVPVTNNDLLGPEKEYHAYVTAGLNQLLPQAKALAAEIKAGQLGTARAAWLTAHLTYERLGAAYGTFDKFDGEIDGIAFGLAGGVRDPGFTGFYRIEYGLWHGQNARELAKPAGQLVGYVKGLITAFPDLEIDLLDIGLRTHEILENAVQFQLTGLDDYGSGTTLATTAANLTGTRELLTILHPLLVTRYTALPQVYVWLSRLATLLNAQHHPDGSWTPVSKLAVAARERIDAAAGQALTELAPIAAITEPRRI